MSSGSLNRIPLIVVKMVWMLSGGIGIPRRRGDPMPQSSSF